MASAADGVGLPEPDTVPWDRDDHPGDHKYLDEWQHPQHNLRQQERGARTSAEDLPGPPRTQERAEPRFSVAAA